MIGNIIGSNFKIISKLGEGGMGAVYRGMDMMTEREVAIKALRPELASQPEVAERFRSEAVTLAKLNHPNIATLYNFFRQGDEYYMILEFVRGETLDSLLSKHGAMPVEQAVPLFCKVLEGIDHAHEEGIVHRDIKPANVMLTTKGNLKVLDFGIARILGTARMTKAGHLIGTIEYMAPEQVKGLETDARSDIYSLGMLLYELLTGRVPFDIQNEFELMSAQINQMPVPPRELNQNIPPLVEEAIMHAIAKDPDARYQTAGEFREVLMSAGIPMTAARTGNLNTADRNNPYAPRAASTTPPVSQPAMPAPSSANAAMKETRLGVAGAAMNASAAATAGAKETRLGTAATMPPAYQAASVQLSPVAQASGGSFFSKLTPLHYIGGGIAALFVLGVLITVSLVLLGGSKKGETAKPLVTKPAVETPVTPPQAAPATQQAGTQQPGSIGGGGDPSALPASSSPSAVKTGAPLPLGDLTIDSPKTSASSGKSAPKTTAPPKPRNNDAAAADARRKREAALRALDQ
jgi:serine/threonine-protein kinase